MGNNLPSPLLVSLEWYKKPYPIYLCCEVPRSDGTTHSRVLQILAPKVAPMLLSRHESKSDNPNMSVVSYNAKYHFEKGGSLVSNSIASWKDFSCVHTTENKRSSNVLELPDRAVRFIADAVLSLKSGFFFTNDPVALVWTILSIIYVRKRCWTLLTYCTYPVR